MDLPRLLGSLEEHFEKIVEIKQDRIRLGKQIGYCKRVEILYLGGWWWCISARRKWSRDRSHNLALLLLILMYCSNYESMLER